MWVLAAIAIIPILYYGYPILIVGAVIGLLHYLDNSTTSLIRNTFAFFNSLFFIAFLFLSLAALVSIINNGFISPIETPRESKVESSTVEPIMSDENGLATDSIISHYREWKDYKGNVLSGVFKMRTSSIRSSNQFRNNYSRPFTEENFYSQFFHSYLQ